MIYLALGAGLLALMLWASGNKGPLARTRGWRFLSAAGAIVAFVGAGFTGLRGAWGSAIVLLVLGVWLVSTVRPPPPISRPKAPSGGMSLEDAYATLGLAAGATPEEIRAAYARLIRRVHPDQGGAPGLAAQLNAARDRLVGKK